MNIEVDKHFTYIDEQDEEVFRRVPASGKCVKIYRIILVNSLKIWKAGACFSGERKAPRSTIASLSVSVALRGAGLALGLIALPAHAQTYADPEGSGAIVSALHWIQGTLLGTTATVVAVIAVAFCGYMMLTGRLNWRHGAAVILGCFILFGATSIVAGIQTAASGGF